MYELNGFDKKNSRSEERVYDYILAKIRNTEKQAKPSKIENSFKSGINEVVAAFTGGYIPFKNFHGGESHQGGRVGIQLSYNSHNQERRKDTIVIDSEFLQLDDLEAYLRLPGDWPVAKVKFEIKKLNDKKSVIFTVKKELKKLEPVSELFTMQSLEETEKPVKKGIRTKRIELEKIEE